MVLVRLDLSVTNKVALQRSGPVTPVVSMSAVLPPAVTVGFTPVNVLGGCPGHCTVHRYLCRGGIEHPQPLAISPPGLRRAKDAT